MRMKRTILAILLLNAFSGVFAQRTNPEYDSTLARKLGADERGMKMYVLAVLKSGPARIEAGAFRDSLFRGHFANMKRLADAGKLVIAGPFETNENAWRGLFIFNVPTVGEARELVKGDPTVVNRIFDVEYYEWYGSAAISEYIPFDRKLRKTLN